MSFLRAKRGAFYDGQTFSLLGRVTDDAFVTLVKADIATVTLAIYDQQGADSFLDVYAGAGLSATEFFDALQKDDSWPIDAQGFNFKKTLDPDTDISGGAVAHHEYVMILTVTTSGGKGTHVAKFEAYCLPA